MKFLGIEFAPFFIPWERRLQTFAVSWVCTKLYSFAMPICSLFIYFLYTKYFFISLMYFMWYLYDFNKCSKGGRRCEFVRRLRFWKYFADYFPVKMIKTAEFDPNKNYILGYHPHGILGCGLYCFATEGTNFSQEFPGITPHCLTLKLQFLVPFHRDLLMSGGVCSATRESIEWLLTKEGKGNALVLVIGGSSEALDAHPGTATLILKRRKGFIKLALQHGASLVPVFAFGENDILNQVHNTKGSLLRRMQERITKFLTFPVILYYGRGLFQYNYGIIPHRRPIHVVIGKPIDVDKTPEPTEEDINTLHEKYVNGLTSLFEEYKPVYGPDVKLKIT